MACEYVRRCYKVPAEIGRRVRIDGREGVIAEDRGAYIGVLMDDDPPTHIMPYHPTSHVEYLDMGPVRKMTRAQQRYQDYLKVADCFDSFADYLRQCFGRKRESGVPG